MAEHSICVVCDENVVHTTKIYDCNHLFCAMCTLQWSVKDDSCPMCRKLSTKTKIEHVQEVGKYFLENTVVKIGTCNLDEQIDVWMNLWKELASSPPDDQQSSS